MPPSPTPDAASPTPDAASPTAVEFPLICPDSYTAFKGCRPRAGPPHPGFGVAATQEGCPVLIPRFTRQGREAAIAAAVEKALEPKFDVIDRRFEEMDAKSDRRFEEMEAKSDQRFKEMDAKWQLHFEEMDAKWDRQFADLRGEFTDLSNEFAAMRHGFADLRGEFADLSGEFTAMRHGFADVRNEVAGLRERANNLTESVDGKLAHMARQIADLTDDDDDRTIIRGFDDTPPPQP